MHVADAKGVTVLEAIVTLAIVTGAVLSLAGLARQVTDTVARSRRHLSAAVLADGFVATRIGWPLVATPPDCLDRDIGGCMEELDGEGRPAAGPPAYVRRWRIAAVAGAPVPAWSLTVCVVSSELRQRAAPVAGACVARIVAETVQ